MAPLSIDVGARRNTAGSGSCACSPWRGPEGEAGRHRFAPASSGPETIAEAALAVQDGHDPTSRPNALAVYPHGRSFEVPDWMRSQCFWVPTQPNLLIRDNQTLYYEAADDRRKRTLEVMAWGRPALDQLALKDLSSS